MDRSDAHLHRILAPLYEEYRDPRGWIPLLDDVCRYMGGDVAQLVLGNHDRSEWNDEWFYSLTPNRPPDLVSSFLKTFGGSDPRRAIYLREENRVYLDHEMEPEGFERSEIVSEFLDPFEMRRQICAVFVKTQHTIGTLNVFRPRAAGSFDQADKNRFAMLMGHFRRAYTLHEMFDRQIGKDVPLGQTSLSAIVDVIDRPIFVCTQRGLLLFANRLAAKLIDERVVTLAGGYLVLADARAQDRMMRAFIGGARLVPDSSLPERLVIETEVRRYGFDIFKLPGQHPLQGAVGPQAHYALIGLDASPLQRGPALTRRERECMHWIAEGKTDDEIATIVGIKRTTVRFHVDSAREKLGAITRAQAVAKLVRHGL